jgi:hypothetical protein
MLGNTVCVGALFHIFHTLYNTNSVAVYLRWAIANETHWYSVNLTHNLLQGGLGEDIITASEQHLWILLWLQVDSLAYDLRS